MVTAEAVWCLRWETLGTWEDSSLFLLRDRMNIDVTPLTMSCLLISLNSCLGSNKISMTINIFLINIFIKCLRVDIINLPKAVESAILFNDNYKNGGWHIRPNLMKLFFILYFLYISLVYVWNNITLNYFI